MTSFHIGLSLITNQSSGKYLGNRPNNFCLSLSQEYRFSLFDEFWSVLEFHLHNATVLVSKQFLLGMDLRQRNCLLDGAAM